MEQTTIIKYNAPRQFNIGDILYCIDTREGYTLQESCPVCEGKGIVNVKGYEIKCSYCSFGNKTHDAQNAVHIRHYTVATVKINRVEQYHSPTTWKLNDSVKTTFGYYRKRGRGYIGDRFNFVGSFDPAHQFNRSFDQIQAQIKHIYSDKNFPFLYTDYKLVEDIVKQLNDREIQKLTEFNQKFKTKHKLTPNHKNDPKE